MLSFARWIAQTSMSSAIANHEWIVPTIQTVHILAICMLMGSVLMVELNLIGLADTGQSLRQTSQRFLPWVWGCMAVLFVTGLLMIVGEPVRELANNTFWVKMGLIVVASVPTLVFHLKVRRSAGAIDGGSRHKPLAIVGFVVFAVWCMAAVAGRFIAYGDYPQG